MEEIHFGDDRVALGFGESKINLHAVDATHPPTAAVPTPGSADLCFIVTTPLDAVITELDQLGIEIIEDRWGERARGGR